MQRTDLYGIEKTVRIKLLITINNKTIMFFKKMQTIPALVSSQTSVYCKTNGCRQIFLCPSISADGICRVNDNFLPFRKRIQPPAIAEQQPR